MMLSGQVNRRDNQLAAPEIQAQEIDEDKDILEPQAPVASAKVTTSRKYRPKDQRERFITAVNAWVERKYTSAECRWWDGDKTWILTEQQIKAIAMHPGMTSVEDLKSLKPSWIHYKKWGSQLFEVIDSVNQEVEAEKQNAKEEQQRAKEEQK